VRIFTKPDTGIGTRRPRTRQLAQNFHDRREILRSLMKKQEFSASTTNIGMKPCRSIMAMRTAMPYDGIENRAGSGGARTRGASTCGARTCGVRTRGSMGNEKRLYALY
jgi:hypothetical protein